MKISVYSAAALLCFGGLVSCDEQSIAPPCDPDKDPITRTTLKEDSTNFHSSYISDGQNPIQPKIGTYDCSFKRIPISLEQLTERTALDFQKLSTSEDTGYVFIYGIDTTAGAAQFTYVLTRAILDPNTDAINISPLQQNGNTYYAVLSGHYDSNSDIKIAGNYAPFSDLYTSVVLSRMFDANPIWEESVSNGALARMCYYSEKELKEFYSHNQGDSPTHLWIQHGAKLSNISSVPNQTKCAYIQAPILLWGNDSKPFKIEDQINSNYRYLNVAMNIGHLCPPNCAPTPGPIPTPTDKN